MFCWERFRNRIFWCFYMLWNSVVFSSLVFIVCPFLFRALLFSLVWFSLVRSRIFYSYFSLVSNLPLETWKVKNLRVIIRLSLIKFTCKFPNIAEAIIIIQTSFSPSQMSNFKILLRHISLRQNRRLVNNYRKLRKPFSKLGTFRMSLRRYKAKHFGTARFNIMRLLSLRFFTMYISQPSTHFNYWASTWRHSNRKWGYNLDFSRVHKVLRNFTGISLQKDSLYKTL